MASLFEIANVSKLPFEKTHNYSRNVAGCVLVSGNRWTISWQYDIDNEIDPTKATLKISWTRPSKKQRTNTPNVMDRSEVESLNRDFGLTDRPKIVTGMIVSYKRGFYKVRKCTKNTCNLGAIFESTIHHKGVPKSEVKEAYQEWSAAWEQSETYKCM